MTDALFSLMALISAVRYRMRLSLVTPIHPRELQRTCVTTGYDPDSHFRGATKMVRPGGNHFFPLCARRTFPDRRICCLQAATQALTGHSR